MQVIYDSTGKLFMQGTGFPNPEGDLKYAEIEIPDDKYIVSMDTTISTLIELMSNVNV